MRSFLLGGLAIGLFLTLKASAQVSTLPLEGLRDERPRVHTLYNARIVLKPGEVIERGALVIDNGRIREVLRGDAGLPPGDAIDMHGKTLFAGFIDLNSAISLSAPIAPPPVPGPTPAQQQLTDPGVLHFSRRVRPDLRAVALLKLDPEAHKQMRALGFTAALTAPASGIFRGQGALIQLIDGSQSKDALLKADAAQALAFEMSFWPSDEYPGSLMGAIALIRQTLIDANWQIDMRRYIAANPKSERIEANAALDALAPLVQGQQLAIFKANDELDFERIDAIANEFKLRLAWLGNGFEYRRLNALKASGRALIVPLNFPEAPKLDNPDAALNVDLSQLQHWEQAPANLTRLAAAGVQFSLTSSGLAEPEKTFWPNLRRAVKAGLSESEALAALTVAPAQLINQADLGTLEVGKLANIVVADAGLFRDAEAKVYQVFIDGIAYPITPLDAPKLDGTWQLSGIGAARELKITSTPALVAESGSDKLPLTLEGKTIRFSVPGAWLKRTDAKIPASAEIDGEQFSGALADADGLMRRFSATRSAVSVPEKTATKPDEASPIPPFVGYPAGAYAVLQAPAQGDVLISNATLWTLEGEGKLVGDILLSKGKIAAIGQGLRAPARARVIDGSGKHLTPGIIDAHSHTAIARNVNEPSSAITAEVRIGDVLDPTDINIYRQLAGGVTTAQLLHGSANPIGGQSAIVKWRWGESAQALKFAGAFPTIKFALGENVKQSNRGDLFTARYPQTRMGVEQVMRDGFLAGLAYQTDLNDGGAPHRRSLRLEALAEVVGHSRFVNIHSYRQDEILAFARLAQEFELTHVTFQHILEGYKVAEALKSIDAGASGFADWWAFKMEVYDAIPYNGAILTRNGVLSSFNSDSDEMARRLNTEAAKAIKYGGLSELQALALITINPAKHLGIDERVGTLKVGKDADVVIWNGDPLSSLSRVDATFVDGRAYFERSADVQARAAVLSERARITQKVLAVGEAGKPPEPDAEASKPKRLSLWQFQTHQGWLADFAAHRTIYHAGGDVNSCSAQEHHH